MLRRLDSELDRSGNMRTRYILLNLPTQAGAPCRPRLCWLTRIGAWLLERRATLLIISDGVSDALSEGLLRLSHYLAGFASLTQTPSGTRLYLHHWQSERGMTSARQFALRHQADGFQLTACGEFGEVLEHPDQGVSMRNAACSKGCTTCPRSGACSRAERPYWHMLKPQGLRASSSRSPITSRSTSWPISSIGCVVSAATN